MIRLLLVGAELFFLFFLSSWLTQSVFTLCILIFRARSVAVTIITILNFPGTVIHELSHLFTAEVLGVHTGKLTVVPESIQEENIQAGSVMIAHTDPFRRYIIGLAPIVTGMVAVSALSYFLFTLPYSLSTYGILYLLLAVGNSMFSSAEDLKGFVPFIITLGILAIAAYIAGLRVGLTGPVLDLSTKILDALTKSLGIVLALNTIGLLLTKLFISIIEKLTGRKIVGNH